MAEEVKKAPKPVDPNSAKYKLGKIAADAYVDAIEAKKRGEKVAWVSSNFPVEIPETMGIATVYPENQAAGIAARGAGTRMCEVAESEGYSNDICAYARVSLAYAKLKSCPEQDVAMPDVVLCCNNICNCMTKWYENIARMCNIPLIMVDIPYNNTVEVSDSAVKYVRAQFDNAIHQLEELTGKKFDEAKFEAACKHANRTAQNWLKVCDYLQYKPAPMSGFDLFNHMADVVTARGKEAAADAFDLLAQDLEQNIKEGTSTLPFPEKYRVMFEGIPCWPKLPNLFNPLKEIAHLVKMHGKKLIVDAMSSFGGVPLDVHELGIDFLISSANKCIQGVPGFGFIIARRSELLHCKGVSKSLSLNIYDQWEAMEKGHGKWRFTSPTHVVRAFKQAMDELAEEGGVEARHNRYCENHRVLVDGMRSLGFQTLLPDEIQSPVITSFLYPYADFNFKTFYTQLKERGFVIYPGKISQADTFRIGNIGDVFPEDFSRLIEAIKTVAN
mgnify:CR=1 FL=1